MSWFFNKNGDQKKWLVLFGIFFPIITGLVFGSWGILLTIQSNNNREQIEALTKMTLELKKQNEALQQSLTIQKDQLDLYRGQVQYSIRPVLIVTEEGNNYIEDTLIMEISIHNSGGDAYELSATSIKGAKVDPVTFPSNRQIPSLRTIPLRILGIKNHGSGVKLIYRDNTMNKYTQDLIWMKQADGNFTLLLGAPKNIKK